MSSSHCDDTDDEEPNKQLSFFSLPIKSPLLEQPGGLTAPLHTLASIPFRWEEAPGKPRACSNEEEKTKPKSARCLELPPRLLVTEHHHHHNAKITNMPSPTTVLDGPDVGRSLSYTMSFRSFRSPDSCVKREKAGYFGSSRWGSFRKNNNNKDFLGVGVGGSSDFSSSATDDGSSRGGSSGGEGGGDAGENVKVKITRVRRKGSLLSISSTRSHLWGSIYESLKQVVPWKRRERLRKMGK